jgi:hypothetical protein
VSDCIMVCFAGAHTPREEVTRRCKASSSILTRTSSAAI